MSENQTRCHSVHGCSRIYPTRQRDEDRILARGEIPAHSRRIWSLARWASPVRNEVSAFSALMPMETQMASLLPIGRSVASD